MFLLSQVLTTRVNTVMQCKNSVHRELLCWFKTTPPKSEITLPRPPFKVLLNYLTDSFTNFAHWPKLQRASLQVLLIRLHCSEVLLQVLLIRLRFIEIIISEKTVQQPAERHVSEDSLGARALKSPSQKRPCNDQLKDMSLKTIRELAHWNHHLRKGCTTVNWRSYLWRPF